MKFCLIVDDSRVVRKVARRIIEDLNFETEEAADGAIALDLCKERIPDLVLLDWNMPNVNGLEFLNALRQMPNGDRSKVVFCTTENDIAHIQAAIGAGANEYIMKPFDSEIIRTKLQHLGLL